MTALYEAVDLQNIESVREILESAQPPRGADLNGEVICGVESSPLILASMKGNIEVLRLLLDNGADPNIQNRNGSTALIYALRRDWSRVNDLNDPGRINIIRLLLNRGADINIRDHIGRTVLMEASSFGKLEIVRLLLERGADPTITSKSGRTALTIASENTKYRYGSGTPPDPVYIEIVELLEAGADLIYRTQKAKQELSLGKALENPSTYSENMGIYEPNIAEMISAHLGSMAPNRDVTRRMEEEERQEVTRRMVLEREEEDENERMADYLDTMKKYGGGKKRKKKKKKKTQKKKNKKKKAQRKKKSRKKKH